MGGLIFTRLNPGKEGFQKNSSPSSIVLFASHLRGFTFHEQEVAKWMKTLARQRDKKLRTRRFSRPRVYQSTTFCSHFNALDKACQLKYRLRELISFSCCDQSPITQPSKQTAKAAAEQKQEVNSLNINFSLQACPLQSSSLMLQVLC